MKNNSYSISCLLAIVMVVIMGTSLQAQTGTLFVEGTNVGVGIPTPAQRLHVEGTDGSTRVLVKEGSSASGARVLLSLVNSGPGSAKIRLLSGTSSSWDFQTQATGFAFSRVGSGGSELFIQNDGLVRLGPGGASNFVLNTNGDLTIAGSLNQNSSRQSKMNFEQLDAVEILQLVAEMPVTRWTYKNDVTATRHIGPVAEDFHTAFGAGPDTEHISPGDEAGVALAAIQGLNQIVQEKDREISMLKARLQALEEIVLGR